MKYIQLPVLFILVFLLSVQSFGQEQFLHTDGQKIVDANGNNILLRGIGLGGWMLQEGYMMQTGSFGNTQHELKAKIKQLVGEEGQNAFYDAWLSNYCTKSDVDWLKSQGFNSIRLPMHYNLFTLAIEEETTQGQDTWLDKGFEMVDDLLSWCEANEMYLILDLHAAPGGQGKDAAISDYDSSKPSLWESAENRRKTVALWKKIAERYANEPWIGGYDLLNETNWDLPDNSLLKKLYLDLTKAIREVDTKHIIYIEGNWFANDYTGLTPPWDTNMVYSFHKYWSYNNTGSIQWVLDMRKKHNVPLWMGEAGENSNVWFANAIQLFEQNNIGWAWWPYKKIGSVAGTLTIPKTAGYQKLLDYWNGNASSPNSSDALTWLLEQAEMLKLENCIKHNDVLDAMFRQAQGDKSSMAFTEHNIPGTIYATEYDLGANGYAYFDKDSADYHVSTDEYTAWNQGYAYRNDGVDIEECRDVLTNGYNVGWISSGEWLNYTVQIDSTAAYNIEVRYAASGSDGKLYLEVDDAPVSSTISLGNTGAWDAWKTYTINDVVLYKGTHHLKIVADHSGFNLSYLKFSPAKSIADIQPVFTKFKTDRTGNYILVCSNLGYRDKDWFDPNDFTVEINHQEVALSAIEIDSINPRILRLKLPEELVKASLVYVAYTGSSIESPNSQPYINFKLSRVENLSPDYKVIPYKLQAEDFIVNNGFELEDCTDTGAGMNLSYANPGDYTTYHIYNNSEGIYQFNYRAASNNNGRFKMQLLTETGVVDLHNISVSTGGWQSWKTITAQAQLPKGKLTLRMYAVSGEFNLNWIDIKTVTTSVYNNNAISSNLKVFIGNNSLNLINQFELTGKCIFEIFDTNGRKWLKQQVELDGNYMQKISDVYFNSGVYLVKVKTIDHAYTQKIWIH